MKAEAAEKKRQKALAEEQEDDGEDAAEGGKKPPKKAKNGGAEQQKQPDGEKPGQAEGTGPKPNATNSNPRRAELGPSKDAVPAAADAGKSKNADQAQTKPPL